MITPTPMTLYEAVTTAREALANALELDLFPRQYRDETQAIVDALDRAQSHARDTSLDVLAASALAWQAETFPARTEHSLTTHLQREARELADDPSADELADVFLLSVALQHERGSTLSIAVARKLALNKARQWGQPDKHGVVEHVKGLSPLALGFKAWQANGHVHPLTCTEHGDRALDLLLDHTTHIDLCCNARRQDDTTICAYRQTVTFADALGGTLLRALDEQRRREAVAP